MASRGGATQSSVSTFERVLAVLLGVVAGVALGWAAMETADTVSGLLFWLRPCTPTRGMQSESSQEQPAYLCDLLCRCST